MADFYPDVPSWRFAYDKDATVVVGITADHVATQLSSTDVAKMANENQDGYTSSTHQQVAFLFPEKRNLDGYYVALKRVVGGTATGKVETSTNTTNGVDGAWTALTSTLAPVAATSVNPGYRTSIVTASQAGITGVRVTCDSLGPGGAPDAGAGDYQFWAVHLFGAIASGENPKRLVLWHPTSDQRITPAWFDWGNVPRSSSADRTFRVKNNSSSLTATAIRVAQDVLTDATPSVPGQHLLSIDGVVFTPQVDIGNLAPGAISGVLTLRRATPANAQLSAWAHRVYAEATSWS